MILKNNHGFSLVEVLVAVTVFAVGILAVAQMQYISISADSTSAGTTESAMIAQEIAESLRQMDYESPNMLDLTADGAAGLDYAVAPTSPPSAATSDYQFAVSNNRYTAYYNVQDNSPFTDTKTVRIIVLWNDKSFAKSYTIDLIKAKGV